MLAAPDQKLQKGDYLAPAWDLGDVAVGNSTFKNNFCSFWSVAINIYLMKQPQLKMQQTWESIP